MASCPQALKDDWLAENSESREEDVTRQQLEVRLGALEAEMGKHLRQATNME